LVGVKTYLGALAFDEILQMRLVLLDETFFQFPSGAALIGFGQVKISCELFNFILMKFIELI
jgi:hypothetical protein